MSPHVLALAATTSAQDSGLFDVLIPAFEKADSQYQVRVMAVGSGEALRLGERKGADVLLVHSPRAEASFMEAGHGELRRSVMYDEFVIVGPVSDPAGIRGEKSAVEAFRRVAHDKVAFVSRGDDSGTHRREVDLWARAGVEPDGRWYRKASRGMGEMPRLASEQGAYTLTDRSTYLSLRDQLDLEVLVQDDPLLRNPYSVIVVRDAANIEGARDFADWLASEPAQRLIGSFGAKRFGRPLFTPDAQPPGD